MSRVSVIAILFVLFASCSETSLFSPDMSEEEVDIATIDDGELLGPSGAIPVSVDHHGPDESSMEELDYLLIELRDEEGELVGSTEVEAPAAVDIPPVELPDLDPGRYIVSFTVLRNEETVSSQERTVFVVADPDSYRISGIATYPPSLVRGQKGIAQASVSAPDTDTDTDSDSDSEGAAATDSVWLRWRLEDSTIHEGLLADGADQITIEAPSDSGAYTVTLELFPHGEPTGEYEGPAPVSRESRLFVRGEADEQEKSFGPADEYLALFHFDGSAEDTGVGSELTGDEPFVAQSIGSPRLRVSERLFGYELDGESGFEISRLLVPFRSGALSRFSVNLRVRLDELSGERRLVTLQSFEGQASRDGSAQDNSSQESSNEDNVAGDRNFELELRVDERGVPTLALSSAGTTDTGSPGDPVFTVGEPINMSIGVIPGETQTRVRWYADGHYFSESVLSVGFSEQESSGPWSTRSGVTRVGGENGFVGIVDEFGVYFRDSSGNPSIYSDMFRNARERELGSALVYAEGFDDSGVPSDVDIDGNVGVEQGMLALEAGSTAGLPSVSVADDALIFELDLSEASSASPPVLAFAQEGTRLFSVDGSGELSDWTGATESFSAGSSLRLRLDLNGETLIVSTEGGELRVPVRGEPLERIEPQLIGPSSGGFAHVDSVLVYRDSERVASVTPGEWIDGAGSDDGAVGDRDRL